MMMRVKGQRPFQFKPIKAFKRNGDVLYTAYYPFNYNSGITPAKGAALTFTRATTQGGQNKKLQPISPYYGTVASGVPMINASDSDTYPNAEGILCEDNGRNVILRSRTPNHATWTKTNITISASTVAGIDGVLGEHRATAGAANATIYQLSGSSATSERYIVSVWLRVPSGTATSADIVVYTEDSVGAEHTEGLTDCATGAAGTVTTSWKRFYVTQTFSAGAVGNAAMGVKFITNGLVCDVDGLSLEDDLSWSTATVPSSFIETDTTSVLRNAVEVNIPVSEFSKKFSWLAMWQPFFSSTTCVGSTFLYLQGSGDTGWAIIGDIPMLVYSGTIKFYDAVTWSPFDWICIGGYYDSDADVYSMVWNGIILDVQTTAHSTPTFTAAQLADGCVAHLRIYNNKILTQGQVTSEYNDMKSRMGL